MTNATKRRGKSLRLSPWQIFLRAALLCSLIGVGVFGVSLRRIERLPLVSGSTSFQGEKAFQWMKDLSKKFPDRLPWNPNRAKAASWLKNEFRTLGYEPQVMGFSEVIRGKRYTDLENIYVEKKGSERPNEIILAVAHYDVAENTHEGAMDDASGVGIVLELARIFKSIETKRTMIFLLTDSEEFGAFWGARTFAKSFDRRQDIIAVANFDFVGPTDQTAILTLTDGLKTGYTPLWLRELALDAVRSIDGIEALDLINVVEFIQRALLIPAADHGPFLAEGIPAFNWVGQQKNFAHQMRFYHHTPNDVVEIMKPKSMSDYGRAAERLLKSIQAMPTVPENFRDSSYWKITQELYLDGWVVTLLHVLGFIPFLLYSFSRFSTFAKPHPKNIVVRVFKNELKNIGILFGAFLIGYVFIRLLPALKIITQFENFPATQKSVLLYTPDFLVLLSVVLLVFIVYWIFTKTFAAKEDDEDFLEVRHAVHAILLAIIVILAFIGNSYLAVLLLMPPAYLWTAIRHRRRREDKALNTALIVGGAITLIIIGIVMGSIFHVGVIYWYLFLAAAYGLVSVYTGVVFFMAITLMLRLLGIIHKKS